jgi:hypothetical protein
MATETKEITATETKQQMMKPMKEYQTNCNEKDAKGKPCWGPLKQWTTAPADLLKQIPAGGAIFRCQSCWQMYHGQPHEHVHRKVAQN